MEINEKTEGEKRVRTSFNPSDESTVQHIKERAAEFINYVNDLESAITPKDSEDFLRNKIKAIDAIEEAAMYAVKAATA